MLQRKRSTTLLYGDSGIGKTTVLEALRDRIRTERIPDAFCGFYECEVGKDADPAIPCFRDLLDHHLAGAKEWEGELRIAIGKAVIFTRKFGKHRAIAIERAILGSKLNYWL